MTRTLHAEPGQRYGRGIVLEEIRLPLTGGQKRRGEHLGMRGARLRCDCGNEYTARIRHLISGNTKSCGCLYRELARDRGRLNLTHGLRGHPLYRTWYDMMRRCYNPKHVSYPWYGGRGIAVCERWHDVATFVSDIERWLGPRPPGMTLDRICNGHDYRQDNVRWAPSWLQMVNSRTADPDIMDRRRRVFRCWQDGMTQPEIARHLGIEWGKVRCDLRWITNRIAELEQRRAWWGLPIRSYVLPDPFPGSRRR